MVTRQNRGSPLEKRCEDLKLLRCLIRPSLRHEKQRSFLFSRLDLLNRTDPGEEVRNVAVICIPDLHVVRSPRLHDIPGGQGQSGFVPDMPQRVSFV